MPGNGTDNQEPISVETMLRQAAFEAWAATREEHQHNDRDFFNRVYLGHYTSLDHYVETLVDDYQLDAKLDTAVAEPFRRFLDVDISGLARSLVRNGTLYGVPAAPVGVWVFNGEIE
jgi:hypothetical protein